jgi:hypothetical protein
VRWLGLWGCFCEELRSGFLLIVDEIDICLMF